MIDSDETEEEFKERLRKISEEVKADIYAGRYKGGMVHPNISAQEQYRQFIPDEQLMKWAGIEFAKIEERYVHDAVIYGRSIKEVFFNECHYIKPSEFWVTPKETKEKDWKRTKFVQGPATTPNAEKRAKLRAKRKAKKEGNIK